MAHFTFLLPRSGSGGKNAVKREKNWFSKFCPDNLDIKDAPRYERSVEADEDEIKTPIETNNNSRNFYEIEFVEFVSR